MHKRHFPLLLCIYFVALSGTIAFTFLGVYSKALAFFTTSLLLCIILPDLISLWQTGDIWDTRHSIALIIFFSYVFAGLYHIFSGFYFYAQLVTTDPQELEILLTKAELLICLGYGMYKIGYRLHIGKRMGGKFSTFFNRDVSIQRGRLFLLLCIIIGLYLSKQFIQQIGSSIPFRQYEVLFSGKKFLTYLCFAAPFFAFGLFLYSPGLMEKIKAGILWLATFMIYLLLAISTGGRAQMILYPALTMWGIAEISGYSLPRRWKFVLFSLAFLIFTIISPILFYLRTGPKALKELPFTIQDIIYSGKYQDRLKITLTEDVGKVDITITILGRLEEWRNYLLGKPWLDWFLSRLPSQLTGGYYSRSGTTTYMMQLIYNVEQWDKEWAQTVTYAGEWFLNFGIIGVLLGFLLLGILSRAMSEWKWRVNGLSQNVLYILSWYPFAFIITATLQNIIYLWILRVFFPFLLFYFFCRKSSAQNLTFPNNRNI